MSETETTANPSPSSWFGFTLSQTRVLAGMAILSLALSGTAILQPLLWPRVISPALPILDTEDVLSTAALADPEPVSVSSPVTAFVLDPNTAPADSLELLPGIGRVLADRIIAWREKREFKTALDLLSVKGIGSNSYEKLRPFIRIQPDRMKAVKN